MKLRWISAGLTLALWSSVLLTACSKGSSSDNENGGNGNQNPGTTGNTVSITNFSFSPSNLTVKAGTTITWTNNDNAPHTVTADNGSFTSSTLNKGDTYSHQFSTAGTYPYHCEIHPSMKATVVAN